MNIGIDARMYGPRVGGGGLGRYVEQLVNELKTIDRANRYVLFLKRDNWDDVEPLPETFEKRPADIHWYTLREQLELGQMIDREGLDLIHFPHWNVPIFLKTPFIVTIHDLILLEEPRSARATTRHPLVYAIKYAAYRFILKSTLRRAKKIIAVSAFTKASIQKHFPDIPDDKIVVVYEGVTHLSRSTTQPLNHSTTPYILYVGNAYPHKNLEALLHAFSFFCRIDQKTRLVLAGRGDVFYERLKREAEEIDIPSGRVEFHMHPSDAELADLYQGASLYVFPSRIEGFGLPGLEAMQAGIPVAAARAGSLPEVFGDAAEYFHPDDIEEMVAVMQRVSTDQPLREQMVAAGTKRVKQFSWQTMAKKIEETYEEVCHGKNPT